MTVDEWLAEHQNALPLVALVREAASLDEAVKWGRLTFTVDQNWHHWLCAVAATRAGVALVFHKGALLPDPTRLLDESDGYTRQGRPGEGPGRTGRRACPGA